MVPVIVLTSEPTYDVRKFKWLRDNHYVARPILAPDVPDGWTFSD